MKTYYVKSDNVNRQWILVDATDKTLGRLASELARVLRGKHKAFFAPHMDCGDGVVVINSEKVRLSGNKMKDKAYYRYSGYIGGIKETHAFEMLEKHPDRLINLAVRGMMPKNKMGRAQMKRLRVYAGGEHPHKSQSLKDLPSRLVGVDYHG